VLVGEWSKVRAIAAAQPIEMGPAHSGVYVRWAQGGANLVVLAASGSVVRSLGRGAGLVAATKSSGEGPVWVITGTNGAGVDRAAHALDAAHLEGRFAVALEPSGAARAVPR
jgi:hypothetical protein